jgi:hypothetical protein
LIATSLSMFLFRPLGLFLGLIYNVEIIYLDQRNFVRLKILRFLSGNLFFRERLKPDKLMIKKKNLRVFPFE